MKKIISSAVVAIALVGSSLNAADYYATVNGEKITKADVMMVLQDSRIDFDQLPKQAQNQVLEQIINKVLVSKNALENGMEKNQEFNDALNKMKLDLAFQMWQRDQLKSIKISEEEKKDFYEKNKDSFVVPDRLTARHILVKTEEEAKNIIKQLDKSSKKEEKFIELAKSKSTGPSGPKGGDLGTFNANQMVPEFADAAKALTKNSYSKKPVKTQFGYHVIYLNDKKEGKSLSFNEVKGNISQILTGNKYNKEVKKLSDKLREKATIVIK